MKFIADAMLGKLAKRLRLLGHDVLYDAAFSDNDLIRLALEQDRTILTRDTVLASRPLAQRHLFIDSDHVDLQLRQVEDACSAEAAPAPLSRCSICNGILAPVDKSTVCDRVPELVLRTAPAFFQCRACERIYWEGSHVKNMADIVRRKKGPAL
jgi:uncharacterized protein with PIN domain